MKITIITIVKNDINHIISTIRSVLSQSYKNLEYIIIDGYSKDGTYQKIKNELKNKQKKFNIKLFRKSDKSMYEALNNGIKHSKGEIIGLLHSGDRFYSKSTLNLVAKSFNNKNVISGNVIFKNKINKITRLWNYEVKRLTPSSSYKIAHTSLFIRRNLIKNVGNYSIKYKISSDTDFIIRLSKNKNTKYGFIKKYLIIMSNKGLSSSYSNLMQKIYEDLNIYFYHFNFLFLFFYIKKIIYKLMQLFIWKLS